MDTRRRNRGPSPPSPIGGGGPERPASGLGPGPGLALVSALLALFAVTQSRSLGRATFLNDDYVFIDLVRNTRFADLFDAARLPFHWYRPLSSSLWFWLLDRTVGLREGAAFAAELALMLVVWVTYFVLVRRLAGARVAAVATAGAVAMTAWTPTVLWISGAQGLWMMLWTMLAIGAFAARRTVLATVFLLAALLSKETAIVLPAILSVWAIAVAGLRGRELARAIAPPWLLTLAWFFAHPWLRLRMHPERLGLVPGEGGSPLDRALRTVLVPFNLHLAPAPASGWPVSLAWGALGATILLALLLLAPRLRSRAIGPTAGKGTPPGTGRLAGFGVAWAVLAWLPLLAPTDAWNAYYAVLGALGAWFALGIVLARRPAIAVPLIVALALVRPAVGDTPVYEWGHESWQRYSGEQMKRLRGDLLRLHPSLPRGSRLWFANSPRAMNIIGVHDHPFRVWYADTTLHADFMSEYRPPAPGAPGRDYFFNFFPDLGWVETVTGPEDVPAAIATNPHWEEDHDRLGGTLLERGDAPAAYAEFVKLADAEPDHAGYAFKAGACALAAGRLDDARHWLEAARHRSITGPELQPMIEASWRELEAAERATGSTSASAGRRAR